MSPCKTNALERYLDIFKAGSPFEQLESLFDPALRFRGPLFSFDDAKSYIEALESDPPRGIDYTLLTSL